MKIPCRSIFFALFLAAGCVRTPIHVIQEQVNQAMLASSFAQTPDPLRREDISGQRLLISWRLPKSYSMAPPWSLELQVIFKDLSQEQYTYAISRRSGTIEFDLLGPSYRDTKGLLTYQILLKDREGQTVSVWRHRLWFTLIVPEGQSALVPPTQEIPTTENQDMDPLENNPDEGQIFGLVSPILENSPPSSP